MTSMTREEMYEMHGLLHRLWSKSGTTAYDKKEWLRLESLIGKSICTMIGPEAEREGYMNLISNGKWLTMEPQAGVPAPGIAKEGS